MPKTKEYGTSPVKDKPFIYFSENLMCADCQMRDCPKYAECIRFFDLKVVNARSLEKWAIQFVRDIRPPAFVAILLIYPKLDLNDESWHNLIIPVAVCMLSFSVVRLYVAIHRRRHVSL
jgi:hypothetical protein